MRGFFSPPDHPIRIMFINLGGRGIEIYKFSLYFENRTVSLISFSVAIFRFFFLWRKYIRICIFRAMQIIVCGVYKINIRKAFSEAEIRYLMIASLVRAYAVTPTLKAFILPCINVGTSIIQHNTCFTGYGNRYRVKDKITQREDKSFP